VCLGAFFLEEKKNTSGNEKSIFANDTYPMCENVNSHNNKKKHINLLRWMQEKLIVIIFSSGFVASHIVEIIEVIEKNF
jgi:hypothetical protein